MSNQPAVFQLRIRSWPHSRATTSWARCERRARAGAERVAVEVDDARRQVEVLAQGASGSLGVARQAVVAGDQAYSQSYMYRAVSDQGVVSRAV